MAVVASRIARAFGPCTAMSAMSSLSSSTATSKSAARSVSAATAACAVAGVRDHEEVLLAEAVDDEVVDDPALSAEQQAVLRLAERDDAELAGEGVVEEGGGLRARRRGSRPCARCRRCRRPCARRGARRGRWSSAPASASRAKSVKLAPAVDVQVVQGAETIGHGVLQSVRRRRDRGRWELPLCHGPESFTRRTRRTDFHRRRDAGDPASAFQSGLVLAV